MLRGIILLILHLNISLKKYLKDVVWSYSGVRPLYNDGTEEASAATRDYVLKLEHNVGSAPLLNIFGGKITTYRKLAEAAVAEIMPVSFPT